MGWPLLLKDVRHVPNLRLNLVSTSKLDNAGYNVNFDGGKLKLSRGSLIVAQESLCCLQVTGKDSKACDEYA